MILLGQHLPSWLHRGQNLWHKIQNVRSFSLNCKAKSCNKLVHTKALEMHFTGWTSQSVNCRHSTLQQVVVLLMRNMENCLGRKKHIHTQETTLITIFNENLGLSVITVISLIDMIGGCRFSSSIPCHKRSFCFGHLHVEP